MYRIIPFVLFLGVVSNLLGYAKNLRVFEDFSNLPGHLKYDETSLEAFCDAIPIFSNDSDIATFRKILETRYFSDLDNQTILTYLSRLSNNNNFKSYHPYLKYFIYRQKSEVFNDMGSVGAAFLDIKRAAAFIKDEKKYHNDRIESQFLLTNLHYNYTKQVEPSLAMLEKVADLLDSTSIHYNTHFTQYSYWKAYYYYELEQYEQAQAAILKAIEKSTNQEEIFSKFYPLLIKIQGFTCSETALEENLKKALQEADNDSLYYAYLSLATLEAYQQLGVSTKLEQLCEEVHGLLNAENCIPSIALKSMAIVECALSYQDKASYQTNLKNYFQQKLTCELTYDELRNSNELLSQIVQFHWQKGNIETAIEFHEINLKVLDKYSEQTKQNAQIIRFYSSQNTERFKEAKLEKQKYLQKKNFLISSSLVLFMVASLAFILLKKRRKQYELKQQEMNQLKIQLDNLQLSNEKTSDELQKEQDELEHFVQFSVHSIKDSYQQLFTMEKQLATNPLFEKLRANYTNESILLSQLQLLIKKEELITIALEELFLSLKTNLVKHQNNIQFTFHNSLSNIHTSPKNAVAMLTFLLLDIAKQTSKVIYFYASEKTDKGLFMIEIDAKEPLSKSTLEAILAEYDGFTASIGLELKPLRQFSDTQFAIYFNG